MTVFTKLRANLKRTLDESVKESCRCWALLTCYLLAKTLPGSHTKKEKKVWLAVEDVSSIALRATRGSGELQQASAPTTKGSVCTGEAAETESRDLHVRYVGTYSTKLFPSAETPSAVYGATDRLQPACELWCE